MFCLYLNWITNLGGPLTKKTDVMIVMAFLFQVTFLHSEVVHWISVVGVVIVCIGVCVSALRRWLRGKPGKFETLWLILNCGVKRQEEEPIGSKGIPESYMTSSSEVVLDIKKTRSHKVLHETIISNQYPRQYFQLIYL